MTAVATLDTRVRMDNFVRLAFPGSIRVRREVQRARAVPLVHTLVLWVLLPPRHARNARLASTRSQWLQPTFRCAQTVALGRIRMSQVRRYACCVHQIATHQDLEMPCVSATPVTRPRVGATARCARKASTNQRQDWARVSRVLIRGMHRT